MCDNSQPDIFQINLFPAPDRAANRELMIMKKKRNCIYTITVSTIGQKYIKISLYIHNDLLHVSVNHVAIFMDLK